MDLTKYLVPVQQNQNYISITREEFQKLCALYGEEVVLRTIVDWVRTRFPHKNLYFPLSRIRGMMRNLGSYKPVFVSRYYTLGALDMAPSSLQFRGRQIVLINFINYYAKFNVLPDYFTDHIRLSGRRLESAESPLAEFQRDPTAIVKYCFANYPRLNEVHLREAIYECTHECTEFKPSVMVAMIERFQATRILDFSAGRAARLIAAIAKHRQVQYYTGIDPDERLFPYYQQVLNEFVPETDQHRFAMIQGCAQDPAVYALSRVANRRYDFCMTSVPYFDLEHYSDAATQSDVEFKTVAEWLEGFLYPAVELAWKVLEVGGHLIMNVNDPGRSIPGRKCFTQKFLQHMQEKYVNPNHALYLGVISYAEVPLNDDAVIGEVYRAKLKAPQPMWIWQKK